MLINFEYQTKNLYLQSFLKRGYGQERVHNTIWRLTRWFTRI